MSENQIPETIVEESQNEDVQPSEKRKRGRPAKPKVPKPPKQPREKKPHVSKTITNRKHYLKNTEKVLAHQKFLRTSGPVFTCALCGYQTRVNSHYNRHMRSKYKHALMAIPKDKELVNNIMGPTLFKINE